MSKYYHQKEPLCFLNISCNSYDLPFWQRMDPNAVSTPVMLFDVAPANEESEMLVGMFHKTLPVPEFLIQRIMRVQNPVLWLHYCLKKVQMTQTFGRSCLSMCKSQERVLFHGTYHDKLESIANQGFDWRRQKTHGKMLGSGTYFASQANHAHEFTDCGGNNISARWKSKDKQSNSKNQQFFYQPFITNAGFPTHQMKENLPITHPQSPHANARSDMWPVFKRKAQPSSHFIIVARVLVGLCTVGKSEQLLPPPLDQSCLPVYLRYDSCVDNLDNPTTFAIFDQYQAYPEYIIEYQHNMSS